MRLTSRAIIELIESEYEVSIRRKGLSRVRNENRWPRWMAMKLCRDELGLSLETLDRIFQVSHTSVLYAIRRTEKALIENPQLALEYADLLTKVETRRQEITCCH